MSEVERVIQEAIEDASRYPFLFIGSGMSRRYMGTPGWRDLLQYVCLEVLEDRYAYARYENEAKVAVDNHKAEGKYSYTATLMENKVNSILLSSEKFQSFRERNDEGLLSGHSPMRIFICEYLDSFKINTSSELDLLRQAGVDKISGIITTNYDRLCERLFPDFTTYIGEGDILFSDPSYTQEIYKIHGSVANPDSLVLTEANYRDFGERRKYLAAKLLTIFVEYPVIFLGYSMQDTNIKGILSEIAKCLGSDKLNRLRKRMIFIQRSTTADDVGMHSIAFEEGSISLTRIMTADFKRVFSALASSRKLYSTRFINDMRGSLYTLAERLDPTSDIVVAGIAAMLAKYGPDEKVVLGVTTEPTEYGKPLSVEDIFEDILLDQITLSPDFIITEYLEGYARSTAKSVPVYKYASAATCELGPNVLALMNERDSYDAFLSETQKKARPSKRQKHAGRLSVSGLVSEVGEDNAYKLFFALEENEIDTGALGDYLRRVYLARREKAREQGGILKVSDFRKWIRIYDYLLYKK